jgi:hypothetical protein
MFHVEQEVIKKELRRYNTTILTVKTGAKLRVFSTNFTLLLTKKVRTLLKYEPFFVRKFSYWNLRFKNQVLSFNVKPRLILK